MDGNNRWSKKKNLDKYNGYKKGANQLLKLTEFIFTNTNSNYVSAFALSKPESESSVESKSLSSDENPALKASVLSWR